MHWLRIAVVFLLLAASSASYAQSCTFSSTPGGITFTNFDPSAPSTQTAFTTLNIKCVSASGSPTPAFAFAGLYGSAPLRMKHSVQASFIPYTVAPSRISVSGANQVWRLTAQVLGTDYVNAYAGSYGDTLTISITP
jgi:hypothetical protein